MKILKVTGFSLIELLVVISILGFLAAIAVPTYRTYSYKAKIGSAVNMLRNLNTAIMQLYDKGALGASVTVNGATITNGAASAYLANSITPRAVYHNNVNGVPADRVLTCVFVAGLTGMPVASGSSYVEPTTTTQGTRSGLCILTIRSGATISQSCGIWSSNPGQGGNGYLPPEYLPTGCRCELVNGPCASP